MRVRKEIITFPCFANCLLLSSHVRPGCHSNLQLLQKSSVQVGQWTLCGWRCWEGHNVQTVSQPACGHHVRVLSSSISITK